MSVLHRGAAWLLARFRQCRSWLFSQDLPCTILSVRPTILASYWEDFSRQQTAILKTLPQTESAFGFMLLGWDYQIPGRVEEVVKRVNELKQASPLFVPIFLANSASETALFQKHGLKTVFVQQNAFLDENCYQIIAQPPQFDAIYIARITPFKRHLLAQKINSLYLIGDYRESEKDYALNVLASFSQAVWKSKVLAWQVKKQIAKARVGLCLSKEEGAMFVSAEYLLCGKPLVSTRSLGGREALFDPSYCLIAEDNAESVAKQVEKAILVKKTPEEIRNRTVELMREHRLRFIAALQKIFDEVGVLRSAEAEWEKIFIHKLGLRTRVNPFTWYTRTLRSSMRL